MSTKQKKSKEPQDVEIKISPSQTQSLKQQMNLATVRRIDNQIAGVVDNANHVAMYEIEKVQCPLLGLSCLNEQRVKEREEGRRGKREGRERERSCVRNYGAGHWFHDHYSLYTR